MPTSAMAFMASGFTPDGSVPALHTSMPPPVMLRSSPSAIWDRAELWVQTKSTVQFE